MYPEQNTRKDSGLVYAIRGRWMDRFKIGMWNNDVRSLRDRYTPPYGSDIEMYVFQCSEVNKVRTIERNIHRSLLEWHKTNELFGEECLDTYLSVCMTLCDDSVSRVVSGRMDVNTRPRNLDRITDHAPVKPPRLSISSDVKIQAEKLQSCADLEENEFNEVYKRISNEEASEEDNWLAYKHIYKTAWGIDYVSQEFINTVGTKARNSKVHLCMHVLFPDAYDTGEAEPLRVGLIRQVLSAMGWDNPFDFNKAPVRYEEAKERLLATDMFKQFEQNIYLFNPRPKDDYKWKPRDIGDALVPY